MMPKEPPYSCYKCFKILRSLSVHGGEHQEGWYYWDGNCFCTKCWQGMWPITYPKLDSAKTPQV